ncbi:hypothetical protein RSOLAG1IB_02610 [Rhizoctonia solani AG-1 IB]|uniref:Single-stranded DNA-binding protein RIM1, mitochondrial n=1 Tax=Thanatephorus cucumeris (strain AG1-IB / isolate 7/3/14) TaxID=1108050 RepID=M5BIN7_THACB|nr:hypothetical protein BN14_01041 [Rhizoctonia solani AG-1 IB]CEL57866.1 hypothetical protein RSOLAG1IB_02610 [Rhizoctonia solani AG-1 IB]
MLAPVLRTTRLIAPSAFSPARGFARLTLIGRLGADPELKTASNGTEYVKYVVATDAPSRALPDGSHPPSKPTWHNITSFASSAVPRLTALRKGARVYVEATYEMKRLEANEEFPARQVVNLRHERLMVLDKGPNAEASAGHMDD